MRRHIIYIVASALAILSCRGKVDTPEPQEDDQIFFTAE